MDCTRHAMVVSAVLLGLVIRASGEPMPAPVATEEKVPVADGGGEETAAGGGRREEAAPEETDSEVTILPGAGDVLFVKVSYLITCVVSLVCMGWGLAYAARSYSCSKPGGLRTVRGARRPAAKK